MKVFIVSCLLLSVAFAEQAVPAEKSAFSECFDKDSISCVQLAVRSILYYNFKYLKTSMKKNQKKKKNGKQKLNFRNKFICVDNIWRDGISHEKLNGP